MAYQKNLLSAEETGHRLSDWRITGRLKLPEDGIERILARYWALMKTWR